MGKLSNFFDLFKRNSLSENNNINDKSILNEHENVEFNLKDNDYDIAQIDNNENINASKEQSINNYTLNNTFRNESDFLKLFKYDSIADSSKTFNIETALNNNWDKVDAFATNVSQQMEHKADKKSPQFTGTPTINGNEIATVNNIPAGLSLGETLTTAYRGDRGKIAYDHSQSAHAPSTAQKNSDITKSEIEAKLTGEVSTHTHASDSTKAPSNHASTTTTYGVGTTANYGHAKTRNDLTAASYVDGEALSAFMGKAIGDRLNLNPYDLKLLKTIVLPTTWDSNYIELVLIEPFDPNLYKKIVVETEIDSYTYTSTHTAGGSVQNFIGIHSSTLGSYAQANLFKVQSYKNANESITLASKGSVKSFLEYNRVSYSREYTILSSDVKETEIVNFHATTTDGISFNNTKIDGIKYSIQRGVGNAAPATCKLTNVVGRIKVYVKEG